MDLTAIVERIGSDNPPTIEELAAVREALEATRDEIAGTIRDNKGTSELSELRRLKGEYDETVAALATVNDAHAAAEAEVAEILATVTPEAAPEDDTDTDDSNEDETEDDTEVAQVPVAASVRSALARVRTRPVVEDAGPDLTKVDTSVTLRGKEVDAISAYDIGKAFEDAHRGWGGSKTSVLSIKQDLAPERTLSGDAHSNERKMLELFGTNPIVPVTASGGCCSIPQPIYEQPMIGSLARPIRDSMDVLQASRGAVQAYPPICIPESGADIWTCAQDAAVDPEDPDTWKDCVEVECETEGPTTVEPIYKCLTIGTFQQKFAPEQWQARLFQVDKLAARKAEARLFGWLQDASTANATGYQTGSTYANFIKSLLRAAVSTRQDERVGADAQILAYGPDWMYTAMIEDSLGHRFNAVEEAEVVRARVDQVLANEGVRYIGSPDVANLDKATYDGGLPDYPANAPIVVLAAGATKVLDGGEKNMGIDIVGMAEARQNNVGAFSEFWEGLLVRSCTVWTIDVPIEDCSTILCPGDA